MIVNLLHMVTYIIVVGICTIGLLTFAMLLAKPVMKIFNWFEKIRWFE